jgi:voltage-gated sodium channel
MLNEPNNKNNRLNDKFDFGTVRAGMVTLFRIETLQAWEEIMYVGMFGCDNYFVPSAEVYQESSCKESSGGGFGSFMFFGFVVVFGALVMPTLLVGVITAAVRESNFDVRETFSLSRRERVLIFKYICLLFKIVFRF